MNDQGDPKNMHSVSIQLGDSEGRIEKLPPQRTQATRIRISSWSQGRQRAQALDLSEQELVTLLQMAIRAGILSQEFLENLHAEFEI